MEVAVAEEKKKIFRARKTMKISDRLQLESLHSTLLTSAPGLSNPSPPPLVNGTHKEDGQKVSDKEQNNISDSNSPQAASPASATSLSSPAPFLSLNLSPSPASSQSPKAQDETSSPNSPFQSVFFDPKKMEEEDKRGSPPPATPASAESTDQPDKDANVDKNKEKQTEESGVDVEKVSGESSAVASAASEPDHTEPMEAESDTSNTADPQASTSRTKDRKLSSPKDLTSDSTCPSTSSSSSGMDHKQKNEIKDAHSEDKDDKADVKNGSACEQKMEVDSVKEEIKKEKSEGREKQTRPSSTPPSNAAQEKSSTSGLKRTLSEGHEKDEPLVKREGKRPKVEHEELEAQLELKITAKAGTHHKLEKIVQQLVDERLKMLELTVFEKHFQELKDRVDKINCATKHQTAINTLQTKISRLAKKFGEANQASENKRKQEALAAAAAAAAAAAKTAAAAASSPQAQRPVRTSIEVKQTPTVSSSNTADWDAAEEKERREYKKKEMRHKEMTPEELDSLEDDKDEVNTLKTTRWAIKTFRDFLAQKNMDTNFENYTATTLNDILKLFYASVQSTKEGREYSIASLRCLRAGINRHLKDFNIITDAVFKSSEAVFKAILKRYKKSGKPTSFHHPRIPESDLEIIRCSSALSPDTPLGLVRKVWFDIQLCLARRGRQGNRELTMNSFSIQRDQDGIEYINLAHNPDTKDQEDPNEPHKQNPRGFMFARPGDPLCPVKSFKKYISKCPPDAKSFYLHPKRSVTMASDVWYSREPMGVHYLGDMLKKISEEVGLSRIYTNYSLRSTAVGRLSNAGLETRQVMSAMGHCSESSLQAYKTPSVQERREWSDILSSRNIPTSSVVSVPASLSASAAVSAPIPTSTSTAVVQQGSILQLIPTTSNAASTLATGITTQSQPGTLVLKTAPGSGMMTTGQPLVIQLPLSVNGQTGTLVNFPVSSLSAAGSLNKAKTTPSTTTFILKSSPTTNTASVSTPVAATLPTLQASTGQVPSTQISLARAVYQGGAGGITTPNAGVSVTTARTPVQSVSVIGAMSSASAPATSGPAATGSTAPGPPQGTSLTSKTDNQASGSTPSKTAVPVARPKGSVIDLTEDDDDVQVTGVKSAAAATPSSAPRSNPVVSIPNSAGAGARSSPKSNQSSSSNPQITVHHRPPLVSPLKSGTAATPTPARGIGVTLPPLPIAPVPSRLPLEAERTSPPQQLQLKLVPGQTGIVLSWSVSEVDRTCAPVDSYHLYAFHQDNSSGNAAQQHWKKIGEVNALPLPMACTLTQFQSGSTYHFAVRAKDIHGRFGAFCEPQCTNVISSNST